MGRPQRALVRVSGAVISAALLILIGFIAGTALLVSFFINGPAANGEGISTYAAENIFLFIPAVAMGLGAGIFTVVFQNKLFPNVGFAPTNGGGSLVMSGRF